MTVWRLSAWSVGSMDGDSLAPVPLALMGFGVAFIATSAGAVLWFDGLAGFATFDGLVGVGVVSVFALGIVAGSYWLDRSSLDQERYGRVSGWCIGGAMVSLLANLPLIAAFQTPDFAGNVGWTLAAACMGASAGLLVGLVEARSIQRALRAQAAAIRADTVERQLEWFDYLNSLLRHEILNNVTVIEGYTEQLLDTHDDDPRRHDHLAIIRNRSQDMADVVTDVRVLIQATNGVDTFEAVNLAEVVAEEVDTLQELHSDVDVTVSIPADTVVSADHLLSRAVANLLGNAAEHADGPVHVRVDTELAQDAVVLRVSDDGPGIPVGVRDVLFDRDDGDHGLGLYLVRVIVERYGGDVELIETGPTGTTFRVELPRADVDAEPAVPADVS